MGRMQGKRPPAAYPLIARRQRTKDVEVQTGLQPGLQTHDARQALAGAGGHELERERDVVERVFQTAADLFAALSTPLRLRIINAICDRERTVRDIVAIVQSSQPNISQHLQVLYEAGIVAKRRDSNWVYYRANNPKALELCRVVCIQLAIELQESRGLHASERLGRRGLASSG